MTEVKPAGHAVVVADDGSSDATPRLHPLPLRRLLLRAAIVFTRLTTGLQVTDTHNGLRAMTRRGAAAIRLRQNRMAHASEWLSQIAASGLRYVEHQRLHRLFAGQRPAHRQRPPHPARFVRAEALSMIAQLILSLLLAGILLYAWSEYARSPAVAVLGVLVAMAGLYFVWVPEHSTALAELVGIGRGVDLVLYIWVCLSLIIVLNLHLKLRTQMELITTLARKLALADVRPAPWQTEYTASASKTSTKPPIPTSLAGCAVQPSALCQVSDSSRAGAPGAPPRPDGHDPGGRRSP
jgi:hypothetical protein